MSKNCPECRSLMIEVRKGLVKGKVVNLYPKGNEYRFYCEVCKIEWIYNSLFKWFEKVPTGSQFAYDSNSKLLILCKSSHRTV